METVFPLIPEGFKATTTRDIVYQTADAYACIHEYPTSSPTEQKRYCWQVDRNDMRIGKLVYSFHEAIDAANLHINEPIDDFKTAYRLEIEDDIARVHRELAALHKKIKAAGLNNPDTAYEQAYKAGYDSGMLDERKAMAELTKWRANHLAEAA